MDVLKKLLSKNGRAAIYGLAVAVLAVAGIFGLVSAEDQATWTAGLSTLLTALAPLLALFNLTDDKDSEPSA